MDRGFCTSCGAAVPEGSSFCGACGKPAHAAGPAQPAVAPPLPPMPAESVQGATPPPLAAAAPPLATPLPPMPAESAQGAAPPPVAASRSVKPLIFGAVGVAAIVALVLTLYFTGVFGRRNDDSFASEWSSTSPRDQGPSGFASQIDRGMGSSAAAPVAAPIATPCAGVVPAAEFGAYTSTSGSVLNRLAIGPGRTLTWNGVSIDRVTLGQYLAYTQAMSPRPVLVSRLDPAADPTLVQSVRDEIDRALGCNGARL